MRDKEKVLESIFGAVMSSIEEDDSTAAMVVQRYIEALREELEELRDEARHEQYERQRVERDLDETRQALWKVKDELAALKLSAIAEKTSLGGYQPSELTETELKVAAQGSNGYTSGRISAIKMVRARLYLGLKEAKDMVDREVERLAKHSAEARAVDDDAWP